ncbi:MAG: hypothetical protein RPS47_09215 [Colwellia sp.]|jgi:hypothetical protein
MKDRPKSIIIISWFLIITNVIAVVSTTLNHNNPDVVKMMELNAIPIALQYVLMAVGIVITISSAALMLKANNIGRIMYIGWTIISLTIGLFTSPAKAMMIPGLVFFLVISFFLFRPKANEYFSDNREELVYDS